MRKLVNQTNNSRIAKNTIILFIRLLFTLVISLYVSRLVLEALGVVDFGVYNVVGSVVTLLAFISSTMTTTTQRFLSFEMAKNDANNFMRLFSMCLNIHFILSFLVCILSLIVGYWLIQSKLTIPLERLDAAIVVFYLSLFTAFISLILTPYNAAIISYEKMGVVALLSLLESIFKLSGAILLSQIEQFDSLILYAFILTIITIVIKLGSVVYCVFYLENVKFKLLWDQTLFKSLINYSGWSLWGGVAYMIMNQGVNMLLNIFFGPVVNAARGIAVQVQAAIVQFSASFQLAMNPQIVKNYSSSNLEQMKIIVFYGAKYSFLLLFILTLPVIIEADFILDIWLGNVPAYAVIFVQLLLVAILLESLSSTLIVAMQATGKIALYQTVVGGLLILNLPLSYYFLNIDFPPEITVLVNIFISLIALIVRLNLLVNLIDLNIKEYLHKVVYKVIVVVILSFWVPLLLHYKIDNEILRFLSVGSSSTIIILGVVWLFALEGRERNFLKGKLQILIKSKGI